VNQQATNNGHAPVGFLNPTIYSIAKSANYTNCFHDITVGNNEWSGSPSLFVSFTNYDLCTGLGTPNGTNLTNAMASGASGLTHLSPPQPPYGSSLSALNGDNPNGTWQLFVMDDENPHNGGITNGWILKLTSADVVGFSADLALGMFASSAYIEVSNTVSYMLTVSNYGPSTSSNVLVSDTLPLNSIILATNVARGSIVRNGQLLDWNVGTLATNTGSSMFLTLKLLTAGSILNFASVSATTPDENTADDFAFATVNVLAPTPPVVTGFATTNGTISLTVSSPPLPVVVQASTNLVDWVSIYTNTPPFTFTDTNLAAYPQRYYRVQLP